MFAVKMRYGGVASSVRSSPRPRPRPNLAPIRGELLVRSVSNVYMALASDVRVCTALACVACTSAEASAAACALCSKVLLGPDLAAYDANIHKYKHPDC